MVTPLSRRWSEFETVVRAESDILVASGDWIFGAASGESVVEQIGVTVGEYDVEQDTC